MSHKNKHLNPSLFSSRYQISNKLWTLNEQIAEKYLNKDNLTILDYGAGASPYSSLYKNNNKYIRADIDKSQNADIIIQANKIPLESESADIVLSTQVLEHVEDYNQYLKEAQRILKPDGIIILSTHGYWIYHPHPADYWRWTQAGLKKILSDAGFKVLDIYGIINTRASGIQLFQDGTSWRVPNIFKPLFFFTCQVLMKVFDNKSFYNEDAAVYAVVASKNE
ncbi:MAG: methyltransferase domain-containing protein [Victivallaceae bacterium]|nr:methyltransferase domain-containing protein [Victivallaceae bacterium]